MLFRSVSQSRYFAAGVRVDDDKLKRVAESKTVGKSDVFVIR